MYTIKECRMIAPEVCLMRFYAPHIAKERKAGQFLIIQAEQDFAERIPLTIADADSGTGDVTVIFQTIGASTHKLAELPVGYVLAGVLGPLGMPTHIEKVGHVVCVGGGIGAAPLLPIAQALKAAGNTLTVIIGARNKDLILVRERWEALTDDLVICTDDGSAGRKCLVTVPLGEACAGGSTGEDGKPRPVPGLVVSIGPTVMMRACCETTRPFGIKTMVSLNTIMVDGTGMCGGCRVSVGGKNKFVCVDGPEFDGHQVDFENMMARQRAFKPREEADHHKCHLDKEGKAV